MAPIGSAAARHRGRLTIVLLISVAILVVEVAGGIASGSLALLADAGHVLTDIAAVGLSLLAIRLAARPASAGRTFGSYRLEIFAAAIEGALLFGVGVLVILAGWRRLLEPPEVRSGLMLVIAVVGFAGNAWSMWLLRRAQTESLTVRGAYLEALGDLLGSLAVIVAAIVIALGGPLAADPIVSIAIGLLILPRTWTLMRQAVDVLLEGTPRGVDLGEVRRHILETDGVADVHDLHAWTITSGMNVVSAHVVLGEGSDPADVLDALCACLSGDFDIEHSTFQLESRNRQRIEQAGHP